MKNQSKLQLNNFTQQGVSEKEAKRLYTVEEKSNNLYLQFYTNKLLPFFSTSILNNLETEKNLNSWKKLTINPLKSQLNGLDSNKNKINSISFSEVLKLNTDGIKLYHKLLSNNNYSSLPASQLKGNNDLQIYNSSNNKNSTGLTINQIGENIVYSLPNNNKNIKEYMGFILKFNSKLAKTQFKNISYQFNNSSTYKMVSGGVLITKINKILESFFLNISALISKPIFEITPDKVIIRLFYYFLSKNSNALKRRKNLNLYRNNTISLHGGKGWKRNLKSNKITLSNYSNRLNILTNILTNLINKPVELELTRLHNPYNDSTILVRLLSFIINRIKIRFISKKLLKATFRNSPKNFTNNILLAPSFLAGINIKIAGRLLTHRVIPRKTIKTIHKGILSESKVIYSDTARFTNKNKRGAYSITVTISNNIK